jgi:fido (protein-threonine AMPylation protein)
VLARIVEIRPFEEGSGRVARLACRHVMRRGGALGPVLDPADLARMPELLLQAQAFHTRPLVELLEAACDRAVEIALREL